MTFLVYMALQWGAAALVFVGDNLILRGVLSGIRWKRIVGSYSTTYPARFCWRLESCCLRAIW